jgi:hypothetical protein
MTTASTSPARQSEAALAADGGVAAAEDQLGLGGVGGWFAVGLISQPGLGLFQLGAAEQQAAVVVAGFPIGRLGEELGVQVDSFDVGVEDLDEPIDGSVEVGVIAEGEPVQLGQRGRDAGPGGFARDDGDESFG